MTITVFGDDLLEDERMALNITEPMFNSNFSDVAVQDEVPQLSLEESEALVDDIRRDCDAIHARAEVVRPKIYRLHQGKGWKTLGYQSWKKCVEANFSFSERHSYKELAAAKVVEVLTSKEPASDKSQNSALKGTDVGSIPEITLRPLTVFLKEPDKLKKVFDKVVEKTNGHPTESAMRQAVKEEKLRVCTDRERYKDAVNFFHRLNTQVLMIKGWGGAPAYTKDWNDAEVSYFWRTLAMYRDQFQGWIDDMSNAGLIDTIDASYSETLQGVDS